MKYKTLIIPKQSEFSTTSYKKSLTKGVFGLGFKFLSRFHESKSIVVFTTSISFIY